MTTVEDLLALLDSAPESIEFNDVMRVIGDNYSFTPTAFTCGEAVNEIGTNEGSCKILAFGLKNSLTPQQTLALFGRFYREDVLGNPDGADHANIRNFIVAGWNGVKFENNPLT